MRFKIWRASNYDEKPWKNALKINKRTLMLGYMEEYSEDYHWEIEIKDLEELIELRKQINVERHNNDDDVDIIIGIEHYTDGSSMNIIIVYDDYIE